jgi:hypothetical protein
VYYLCIRWCSVMRTTVWVTHNRPVPSKTMEAYSEGQCATSGAACMQRTVSDSLSYMRTQLPCVTLRVSIMQMAPPSGNKRAVSCLAH